MQTTGANCECNGHVWRMDVGMSGGVLNALPQVPLSLFVADCAKCISCQVLALLHKSFAAW